MNKLEPPSTYGFVYCEVHDAGWFLHKDSVATCPWCEIARVEKIARSAQHSHLTQERGRDSR